MTGWIGLDSGTGNGKYLPLPLDRPGDIWTIGLDRSRNLLEIARKAGRSDFTREVLVGNVLDNPWRPAVFVSSCDTSFHRIPIWSLTGLCHFNRYYTSPSNTRTPQTCCKGETICIDLLERLVTIHLASPWMCCSWSRKSAHLCLGNWARRAFKTQSDRG